MAFSPLAQTWGQSLLVSLSSELYLAPEMMYASLDLVTMIVEATQDLPSHYIKDCFSHILIQGLYFFTIHILFNIQGEKISFSPYHRLVRDTFLCEQPVVLDH